MTTRILKICVAILCLAVAFHLGARSIGAAPQPTSNTVASIGFQGGNSWLATGVNGDTYVTINNGGTWTYAGNVFGRPGPTQ